MSVVTSILLIGIVGIAGGLPVQDNGSQTPSNPGKDEVSHLMQTMLSHVAGILRFMEGTRWNNHKQAPVVELSNSKYAVAEVHPSTGDAMGFILSAFESVFKTAGAHNQELRYFLDTLRNTNLVTYIRDMAMGYSVSDMLNLAMSDPQLQEIYQTAVSALPAFKELMNHLHKSSLQDRALIDVLMGNMPSIPDYNAIKFNHTHYSTDNLINAMKDDQHFQDFLTKVEASGNIGMHHVLKLITGEKLQLLSDFSIDGPSTNSSVKFDENNFLVQYGETFDFLLLNFAKIIQLVEAYDTASPNLHDILMIIMSFDTSMLQPSPGKVGQVKPTTKTVYHGGNLHVVHRVTPHVASLLVKGRQAQK